MIEIRMPDEFRNINGKHGGKQSVRERLRASEERVIAAVEYITLLEGLCKQVLYYSAECHEKLSAIIMPGSEGALKAMEQISICVAPVCGDVQDVKLPPQSLKSLIEMGAEIVHEQEDPDAADSGDGQPDTEV